MATFGDYHELIKYIRRQKFDSHKIYQSILDNWNEFDEVTEISTSVYQNAYNDFYHFTDMKYELI